MEIKQEGVEVVLETLGQMAFGHSRKDSMAKGVCVQCGKPPVQFKDAVSRREFEISGLCQTCQDLFFLPDDEDDFCKDCDVEKNPKCDKCVGS
jgi:hypothetical protein